MRVIIKANALAASRFAAQIFADQIQSRPDSVLGLATGLTPLQMYQELIRMHREEGLDFSRVTTFNLDEYLGLGPDDPGSFHRFMKLNLLSAINLPASQFHIPDGLSSDHEETCRDYEEAITRSGGIDLQLLGIGRDGHIGFNEPGSDFQSRTRVEELTILTRNDNARFFAETEAVPKRAITMGIRTILEARRILLLALGGQKAEVVGAALAGPVSSRIPASALQLHANLTVVLDQEAASLLDSPVCEPAVSESADARATTKFLT